VTGRFQEKEISPMETVNQYRKYAEECDLLAKRIPAHAEAIQKIAEAWRELARAAEQAKK
jgi:hypothetical protein